MMNARITNFLERKEQRFGKKEWLRQHPETT